MNMPGPAEPTPSTNATPPRARSSWLLAFWGIAAGLLTVLVGLAWAAFGIGFGNASASGSGMAAVFVGLWTALAARGIARRRLSTFLGLGLAWLWLIVRITFDIAAVGASTIVLLFLVPAITLPLGLLWAVMVLSGGLAALVRARAEYWRRKDAHEAWAERPRRAALGIAIRLALLIALTLTVPLLAWASRGQEIAKLAQQYARDKAAPAGPVTFGACTMVFLGYELTQHGESARTEEARQAAHETALGDAEAELASIANAGARYVRMGASGDQLLEPNPAQETLDDRYMAAVRRTGMKTVLVDTQHPKVLRKGKLDWDAFCRFQRGRIGYYQERYHPDVYFVVCEPMTYHQFGLTRETAFSVKGWADQLSAMCRLVKSIDPATRTGICLLVPDDRDPEWEVWTRMQNLPELDILSVEIYQPQDFRQTAARLEKYGHPKKFNKTFWIAETYNGWALCANRRWDQDAAWLRLTKDYAQATDAEAVLVWTFGTFVPGGSFLDFGNGKLRTRWGEGHELSLVGQTFAELAGK